MTRFCRFWLVISGQSQIMGAIDEARDEVRGLREDIHAVLDPVKELVALQQEAVPNDDK